MAEFILVRFERIRSTAGRRALVKRMRAAALSAVPAGESKIKVGTISGRRFKVSYPGGEGSVDADGALFELDEPEFATASLIYEIARAGRMAWIDAWGPSPTILFDPAAQKKLPPGFRRPRPALCTSAEHLARMLGVSSKPRAPRKLHAKHQWSREHHSRSKGRLPGIEENPKERYLYVQRGPAETIDVLMTQLAAFIRAGKKQRKLKEPDGGSLSYNDWDNWELRPSSGEVLVPLHVTGYSCRPNSDHLIPGNLEGWLAIARAFARASGRKTATIVNGKTLALDGGARRPLARVESRRAERDEYSPGRAR